MLLTQHQAHMGGYVICNYKTQKAGHQSTNNTWHLSIGRPKTISVYIRETDRWKTASPQLDMDNSFVGHMQSYMHLL